MPERTRLIAAGAITAAAVVVFVSTLAHASLFSPQDETTVASSAKAVPRGTGPLRLGVPSLGIDANVQHVGLGKTGNMAVPSNFTDVGWYRNGAKPGAAGNAVFDGHVDNGLGLPGVFKNLERIQPGAEIDVDYASSTVRFVVTRVETYPKESVPTSEVFSTSGPPGLVLITCEGDWLQSQKTYDHRLVVYARLVASP